MEFAEFGTIGTATREQLMGACGWIAALAEIAPHYTNGTRHALVLALAGALLAADRSKREAQQFVQALCQVMHDDEASSRLTDVETTAAKKEAGQPLVEYGELVKKLGRATVDRIIRHLDIEVYRLPDDKFIVPANQLQSGLGQFNERWAVVPVGGQDALLADRQKRR